MKQSSCSCVASITASVCFASGSIHKKKEKNRKKGLSYEELRLPAITAFTSGRTQTKLLSRKSLVFIDHFLCVSNSDCSSVGLGRDRCLSPRALASDHVELPEVHHGSSPAAASGSSQGRRCYSNAVVNPLSLALPLPLLRYFNSRLHPQAVDITSCGNFAVVGSSSGRVDVYNMQSGLHRGCYGDGGTGK